LLTEAKLVRRFRPAGHDLSGLYAGYYVAELLLELTDPYDTHPELFNLADEALQALSRGESVARHALRFELGALRVLGHLPTLEACAECGRSVEPSGRVAFGLLSGGVLCGACRGGQKQVASITGAVLQTMAQLADPNRTAWRRIEITPAIYGQLRGLLNHYVSHLLGKKLRLHEYLHVVG
jgi:DNA repair protein RecO (recombination protein O)